MTDLPATPHFSLPLLATAQANKEITHNEALALIDALLYPVVEAGPSAAPPASPAVGESWIVGASPTGEWTGQAGRIAIWTAGGWRFVAPREAMRVVRRTDGAGLRFEGGLWAEPPVVEGPSGGAVVDSEARSAIDALILSLAAHGLLISG